MASVEETALRTAYAHGEIEGLNVLLTILDWCEDEIIQPERA